MRANLTIAAKLLIAYALFFLPICYLAYQLISGTEADIGFARKELVGIDYIRPVRVVQDAIVRGADMASLAAQIEANQQARGSDLNTAAAVSALSQALKGTDRNAAAQAAADLISKAADGSNLTLDPDLDSFYTQDVVTVKVPTAVAGAASLAAAAAGTAGHDVTVAQQVSSGVAMGSLQPTLDGIASDIASAVAGNPDKTVGPALSVTSEKLTEQAKKVLADLSDHAKASDAQTIVRPLLDGLTATGTASANELQHLLDVRMAHFRTTEILNGTVTVLLFLCAVGYVLIVVQRGTVRPLKALTVTMRKLSDHDLTTEIDGLNRGDEVGRMARAVQVFKDNMITADRLTAEQAAARTIRELRQAAIERHTQDFGQSISGVMSSLAKSAESMRTAAEAMATAAAAVNIEAHTTATGAAKSSQDLTAVAAAVEQLSATVAEIARQVTASGDVARHAVQHAEASHGTMQRLTEATARIGDVVHLINEIAGQTNLLALNATIEAARAGDAGKGFAVVAGEVRALASQTAKATAEISSQIDTVRSATEEAVSAMSEITGVIGRIEEASIAISSAVEEQSVTTHEIANRVQAVSAATAQTAQAMEQVVVVGEGSSNTSREVLTSAGAIAQEAGTLRSEVDNFLIAIRSDTGDRREYERVSGNGARVSFAAQGRATSVELRDLGRGGASFECDWSPAAGTAMELELPGGNGKVAGRVARSVGREIGVVFNDDPANLARIDRALTALSSQAAA
ncbi:MAG TPA: methyl-accepting chemotaxis protein [Acetobacteraceae bacterium]|nr:methyl-accepting chemotaxis protein [Acetobacteraceae bacterium]